MDINGRRWHVCDTASPLASLDYHKDGKLCAASAISTTVSPSTGNTTQHSKAECLCGTHNTDLVHKALLAMHHCMRKDFERARATRGAIVAQLCRSAVELSFLLQADARLHRLQQVLIFHAVCLQPSFEVEHQLHVQSDA